MGRLNNLFHLFLFLLALLSPYYLNAHEKLLSLSDEKHTLQIEERSLSEVFICLSATKRVFGKNPPLENECYSLNEQSLDVSLSVFLDQPRTASQQIAFYLPSGTQVFPRFEENGSTYVFYSFVINAKSHLFVQALKKDSKQYFYWRTIASNWEFVK